MCPRKPSCHSLGDRRILQAEKSSFHVQIISPCPISANRFSSGNPSPRCFTSLRSHPRISPRIHCWFNHSHCPTSAVTPKVTSPEPQAFAEVFRASQRSYAQLFPEKEFLPGSDHSLTIAMWHTCTFTSHCCHSLTPPCYYTTVLMQDMWLASRESTYCSCS